MAQPLRGILTNQGVSVRYSAAGEALVSVRPPEGLPFSEFRLQDHMAIYGLPDETLLTFEGSHAETFWELACPAAANSGGLSGLADVLITFDFNARYSGDLYSADLASLPTTVRRWLVLSGARLARDSMATLEAGVGNPSLVLDPGSLPLSPAEQNRTVRNIALFAVTERPVDLVAKVGAKAPTVGAKVTLKAGVAMTTAQPDPHRLVDARPSSPSEPQTSDGEAAPSHRLAQPPG